MNFEKIIEIIYSEKDIAKSLAIFLAGVVGLIHYTVTNNATISFFFTIITFPLVNVLFSQLIRRRDKKQKEIYAFKIFDELSDKEIEVLKKFVEEGTTVMLYDDMMNKILFTNVSRSILDSLRNRELLTLEYNQYIIDKNIFILLKQKYGHIEEKFGDMEIPF